MAIKIQAVEYFYTRMENESHNAYEMLAQLASEDINLLAFSAVPFGPNHVELTIFPEMSRRTPSPHAVRFGNLRNDRRTPFSEAEV
jgi:hypothetical protein